MSVLGVLPGEAVPAGIQAMVVLGEIMESVVVVAAEVLLLVPGEMDPTAQAHLVAEVLEFMVKVPVGLDLAAVVVPSVEQADPLV